MKEKEKVRMYQYLDIVQKLVKKAMKYESTYIDTSSRYNNESWSICIYGINQEIGINLPTLWIYSFWDDCENMFLISEFEKFIDKLIKAEQWEIKK